MSNTSSPDANGTRLSAQIKTEAIRLLYRQSKVALLVSLFNAGFLIYVLWEALPASQLLTWFALVAALTLARGLFTFRYFNRPESDSASGRWGFYATIGALLSGLLWGSAGILLYAPDQIAYQALLFFLLGGMGASAFASNTSFIPAFYAFFIPALLPILGMLITEGDKVHFTMAAWGSAYFLAFLYFARNSYLAQLEAIRLRLDNQRLLDKLVAKHHDAEQANVSKTRFLAAASHDLRQPLFALGLYTEMLESETDLTKTRNIAALIKQSFFSLKGLLDALLDISRLDAGVVKVEKKNFYLQEVFDRILFDYEPMAIDKDIALRIVDTSAVVYSDSNLVERILRNLVSNAINYTTKGGVVVGAKHLGDHYEVRVYDSGIGIPQEELGNVFQEFHQLANPERDRGKEIGLGLAIVQRLITLLEESIVVRSVDGRGTAMCFSIQRGSGVAPLTLRERTPRPHAGAVILIIEDDEEVARSMRAFLEGLGYGVLGADSEDEALRLLVRGAAQPDMIISDYRLREGQDGIAAAEAVLAFLGTRLPVMIITGDTAPERIREATSQGYQLLHKPMIPAEFKRAIAQMLTPEKTA